MFVFLTKNIFLLAIFSLFIAPLISLALVLISTQSINHVISNPFFYEYALNTVLLMIGVGITTIIIGVLNAWFVTFYSFPGRKFFEIVLLFPVAIPGYITAFTYINIFEFAGPVQTFLRTFFHWTKGDYYFPEIRSLWGGILIVSMGLYPYIYILARTGFMSISNAVTIARTFGHSSRQILFSIAMPEIRPAIIAGLSLVLMEVIADFGTFHFLAIDTFTTGIYRSWFLLRDQYGVSVLSFVELLFILFILFVERLSRKKGASFSNIKTNTDYHIRWSVGTGFKSAIFFICSLSVILGFVLPIIPLIIWSFKSISIDMQICITIINSIVLAALSAMISVIIAVTVAYLLRFGHISLFFVRFISVGYAVPNAVIALSILMFLGNISKIISIVLPNVMLIGTVFALVYAYVFRFFAISFGAIESGFSKISKEIDWSSALMGHGGLVTCFKVHIPMLQKSLITAFLLVFADTIKELSATLILRPFNFETVATKTYELVNDERYIDAAPYALTIVFIGFISVLALSRFLKCRCSSQ